MTTSMLKLRSKFTACAAVLACTMVLSVAADAIGGGGHGGGGGRFGGGGSARGGGGEAGQRDEERQRRAALSERAPDQSGAEQHRRAARSAHPRVHHRKRGDGGVAWRQLVVVAPSQWRFWVGRPAVLAVRLL